MLKTNAIEQFETHIDGVYAFRITQQIARDDLKGMAEIMNKAFDERGELDMLLCFESEEGATLGAGLDVGVIKAQFRALANVRNYCVANASSTTNSVVDFFSMLIPVEAKIFNSEHNALEHLKAQARADAA